MHANLSLSCFLQLDKSPNLLLSGKEPARAGRLSAAVFQYLLLCLFFSECSKWIPHHFCLDFELSIKDGYLFVYTFIISIVKENLSHQP
uniref:Uncharacterized protein n=1 Tax=Populus davidiana TaxID=266767 RepID=A0A6M2F8S9_9ROSI